MTYLGLILLLLVSYTSSQGRVRLFRTQNGGPAPDRVRYIHLTPEQLSLDPYPQQKRLQQPNNGFVDHRIGERFPILRRRPQFRYPTNPYHVQNPYIHNPNTLVYRYKPGFLSQLTTTTTTQKPAEEQLIPTFDEQYRRYSQSVWTAWSAWSVCSNGEQMRGRGCYRTSHNRCRGDKMEKRQCTGGYTSPKPGSDPYEEERKLALEQLGS